uniref:Ig-like domain-containing protein n=1 Tax=Lates calcarifer TaxID=8187 RepID=A0A4W6FFR4_LATCA
MILMNAELTLEPKSPYLFTGECITFTCDMRDGYDTDWHYTFNWNGQHIVSFDANNSYSLNLTADLSGDYQCIGHHKDLTNVTKQSNKVTLSVKERAENLQLETQQPAHMCTYNVTISGHQYILPTATLRADGTSIPVAGTLTLTCSVLVSGGWKYDWFRRTSDSYETMIVADGVQNSISVSHEGIYRCRGRRGNPGFFTEDSDEILTNRAVVTLQPAWPKIYSGETITVRCEIQGGGDTEWEYEWETTTSFKPSNQHEHRISPASSSHSGDYWCKGRVKSSQQNSTGWSNCLTLKVFLVTSLTVNPDRVQHFTSDSVSLSCEGNSAEWRVKRFPEHGYMSHCSDWWRMTGFTCNMMLSWYDTAVYWCESGSGEFSNAVNITANYTNIVLVSPVHPVAEGDSVTLGCVLRTDDSLSNVTFYKNGKLVQNDDRGELNISAVSKSDEGFYKCEYSGSESSESWMSVKSLLQTKMKINSQYTRLFLTVSCLSNIDCSHSFFSNPLLYSYPVVIFHNKTLYLCCKFHTHEATNLMLFSFLLMCR